MKIGIDTYSYHRFLGEVYPTQKAPEETFGYQEILQHVAKLGIDGISIETCFLESQAEAYLRQLREKLEDQQLEVVVAWGHPWGLEGGKSQDAVEEMVSHYATCHLLGTNVMRIVGSNRRLMTEAKETQLKRLIKVLRDPIKRAEDEGIILAIENHLDFTAEDILELLDKIDSKNLGVTYDTGNALRLGEHPVEAAQKLAQHCYATHLKDVAPIYDGDPTAWAFFASVPFGKGIVNIPRVINTLKDGGYEGIFTIEIDYLHPAYPDEFAALEESVRFLQQLDI
jgi:sugar phosphate isomerase/epimerase